MSKDSCDYCQVVAFACTGGPTHTYMKSRRAKPKKIFVTHSNLFLGLAATIMEKQGSEEHKAIGPAPNFGSKGRHSRAATHRNAQTRQKASPNTAQRERTNPNTKIGQILARQGLSTINTPLPPPRRRKEDHPWRLKRTIA